MNELTIWPWILLCLCVAIVALLFIIGDWMCRPTCNRCPICNEVTGTPESLDSDGNPWVCGHDICDACLASAQRRSSIT